jgi:ABC-type nitrate/sulfonate/bicarbonate transport system substrate-binding protein
MIGALPCLGSGLAKSGQAPAGMKLRVSVGPYYGVCPFFTGYEAGYFEREGFDIDLNRGPSSVQVIPLIAGGQLDVCFLSDHAAFLNAVARGAKIRIVAGREVMTASCRPVGAIYFRRESFPNGLSDMRPLKGAQISVGGSFGGLAYFALDELLRHDGMGLDDVEVKRMDASASLAAVRSGSVAAMVSTGTDMDGVPAKLQLVKGPVFAAMAPGLEYSWVMFGARLLDGDVQTGARFLRAYLQGGRDFLNGRTPAFLDELAKAEGTDPKVARAACRDTFVRDGSIRIEDLERFVRWAAGRGLCPDTLRAADLVDTRFLTAVNGMSK